MGVITATSKASFIKDINNDPVIDTTLPEFGRYYKFDIPAKVKTTTPNGAGISKIRQIKLFTSTIQRNRNITKPETNAKRVVNLPVSEFDFNEEIRWPKFSRKRIYIRIEERWRRNSNCEEQPTQQLESRRLPSSHLNLQKRTLVIPSLTLWKELLERITVSYDNMSQRIARSQI